jgi:putative ABC transport system substrate-binding protein
MRRVGILYAAENGGDGQSLRQFESDCAKLKIQVIRAPLRKREEIPAAFDKLKRERAQGMIVTASSLNTAWKEIIVQYASKFRLPAAYGNILFSEAGGLITYSANRTDLYRRVAAYAVKIFKGAKPGDLPIEQPTKFELIVNLKTAKALGIKIPDVVMLRAETIIE